MYQPNIEKEADTIFKKHILEHDNFFIMYTPIWQDLLQRQSFSEAEDLWNFALNITKRWEDKNSRVHKGTPFYFLGVTQILNGKIDDGFLSMHQAFQEDIETHGTDSPDTPAYSFVILNAEKGGQYFRQEVLNSTKYLEERIESYNKSRGGALTLIDFRDKFLKNGDLREEVFRYIYYITKMKNLLRVPLFLRNNEFSSLQITKLYFDLCLISEKVIAYKNPDTSAWRFVDQVKYLIDEGHLSHSTTERSTIRDDFNADFTNTLNEILTKTYSLTLNEIDEDYLLTYTLRNFAAHNIEQQLILNTTIEELSQRLQNSLFFTIEKLF